LLLPEESLRWSHAFATRFAIDGKQFEELDFVIHSYGGDISAAYTIIRMLRAHTIKRLNACVPVIATSAATLFCLGADTIILDEQANLGSLDTQTRVEGKYDYKSALNLFKSLLNLKEISQETVLNLVSRLMREHNLSVSDCFGIATKFVTDVNNFLLTKLDSEKLGEFHRSLSESQE
jgi:membrane-bound ClpP family serine protease